MDRQPDSYQPQPPASRHQGDGAESLVTRDSPDDFSPAREAAADASTPARQAGESTPGAGPRDRRPQPPRRST